VEDLALTMFDGVYAGRRVLVTGHTGFKGSWMAAWLQRLGAQVSGLALAPATEPNHWDQLRLDVDSRIVDLRDAALVRRAVDAVQPELVFHLGAQSLVRPSYADPLGTWSTNVMGTAHLLDACRHAASVRAIVVVTSDKCYANREWAWPYRENDPIGGHDPYSASKAGTELVAASYRSSFFTQPGAPALATARAGNVIGGGDWAQDRLVPDAARAVARGEPLQVRSPHSTRPWQHVLEPLAGYLLLGQRLLQGDAVAADAWNFGPGPEGAAEVGTLLDALRTQWPQLRWEATGGAGPHEARLLQLDSSKARAQLAWRPVWTLEQGLAATAQWYRRWLSDAVVDTPAQLDRFLADARSAGLAWAAR
jgi:CDP-glucose 4,6-dehydratase